MAESGGRALRRGFSGNRPLPRHDDEDEDFAPPAQQPAGRHFPVTSNPSFQNILAGAYNSLPQGVRDSLPFGKDGSAGEQEEQKDKRGTASWAEVCFVYDIPGDDTDDGLVILGDGSMRRYIQCKGVNALLFDNPEKQQLARNFADFANSCDSDIQIIVKARNLPVDEYLSRYQILIKTEDDYLKWYAEYTDKWFRKIQDLQFVPQRDFYVVVSYQPPDCRTAT